MSEILDLLIDRIPTPIGEMVIIADREGSLRAVDWTDHDPRAEGSLRLHYGKNGFKLTPAHNPSGLSQAINNYFAGDRHRQSAYKNQRHALSASGMASSPRDSHRYHHLVRRTCEPHRPPKSGPRGRPRQRIQSRQRHRPLPPCHRLQRLTHWLRRRTQPQALAPRP